MSKPRPGGRRSLPYAFTEHGALSRAEARLVLILSEADRQNPLFSHPAFRSPDRAGSAPGPNTAINSLPAEPIESYLKTQPSPGA